MWCLGLLLPSRSLVGVGCGGQHLLALATMLPLLHLAVASSATPRLCPFSLSQEIPATRDRAWLHPIIVHLFDLTQPDQKGQGIWYTGMAPLGLGRLAEDVELTHDPHSLFFFFFSQWHCLF